MLKIKVTKIMDYIQNGISVNYGQGENEGGLIRKQEEILKVYSGINNKWDEVLIVGGVSFQWVTKNLYKQDNLFESTSRLRDVDTFFFILIQSTGLVVTGKKLLGSIVKLSDYIPCT